MRLFQPTAITDETLELRHADKLYTQLKILYETFCSNVNISNILMILSLFNVKFRIFQAGIVNPCWTGSCDGARIRLSTAAGGLLYYPRIKANLTE
jgi:hypothetical protein